MNCWIVGDAMLEGAWARGERPSPKAALVTFRNDAAYRAYGRYLADHVQVKGRLEENAILALAIIEVRPFRNG
jgi:hypothetical protein